MIIHNMNTYYNIYSESILDVGFKNAIKQTGFDYDTYEKRGGDYRL